MKKRMSTKDRRPSPTRHRLYNTYFLFSILIILMITLIVFLQAENTLLNVKLLLL